MMYISGKLVKYLRKIITCCVYRVRISHLIDYEFEACDSFPLPTATQTTLGYQSLPVDENQNVHYFTHTLSQT